MDRSDADVDLTDSATSSARGSDASARRSVDPSLDIGVLETRRRFGGFDLPASFAGMLAGLGLTALLGGIFAGIGSVGYQFDVERSGERLSAGGMIAGVVTLFVAFLFGGWVAGRMARYDGVRNGIMSAVLFVVLAALVSGAGAWFGDRYDVFANLSVPQWFSDNATTPAAILSAVAAFIIMLVAAAAGGALGERYHRKADRSIVSSTDAGLLRMRSDDDMGSGARAGLTRTGRRRVHS